ncbi:hypothetical protein [Streptomyces sp. NBC_00466]|uniref:hypothetical protein n=1 Tax=unclassified Streptomyces TaxID=2593676 RepID=UPI00352FCBAB
MRKAWLAGARLDRAALAKADLRGALFADPALPSWPALKAFAAGVSGRSPARRRRPAWPRVRPPAADVQRTPGLIHVGGLHDQQTPGVSDASGVRGGVTVGEQYGPRSVGQRLIDGLRTDGPGQEPDTPGLGSLLGDANSRSSQLGSSRPPPIRPRPPAFGTAAVRAPSTIPPMSARASGCSRLRVR